MLISEMIEVLQEVLDSEGDMPVFYGDMNPMDSDDFEVVPRIDGTFLHIGEW